MSNSTSSLAERDLKVNWHPFTQMKTAGPAIPIVRGEGVWLYDEHGKAYLDGIASWWMNAHGHAHPYLAEKLYEQAKTLEHVLFANFTHPPAIELSERVLELLPSNQTKAFYSDNGSTAVEVGIKMCIQYWHNQGTPRPKLVALEGAYHGDTFGAMSAGARSPFSAPFDDHLFEVEFIPAPIGKDAGNCLDQLERLLQQDEVGGFIFEPLVQGAGGMRMYARTHLHQMLELCHRYGKLAIADEVMTGFYRTGTTFATSESPYPPHIICLSKALTGGTMALGMTTCAEEIYQAFFADDKMKALFHGHSCTANPLACSVALASLDLFSRKETLESIQAIVQSHEVAAKRFAKFPQATNIRQTGVILAMDVQAEGQTGYFNQLRDQIWAFFLDKGIILRPLGNTIYIFPPYCMKQEELEQIYSAIEEFFVFLSEPGKNEPR